MTVSQTIDMYLWKHFFPAIKPTLFKPKIIALTALLYISIFPLSRKFLRHYLAGKGSVLKVDTRKIITGNPEVFNKLIREIPIQENDKSQGQELKISQLLLSNPDHRYALGSFLIAVHNEGEMIRLKILSNYHFGRDNTRITRHIHRWMHDLKERGIARDFDIEGDTWALPFSELSSIDFSKRLRKYAKFDRLYV